MTPNAEQTDTIRHSLGLGSSEKPYRNYYCTKKGNHRLEAMVAAGWMKHGRVINDGRDQYYLVTEAGAAAVNSKLPKEHD